MTGVACRSSNCVRAGASVMSASDKVFAGSIPEIYDTYLVPLIFEAYASIWRAGSPERLPRRFWKRRLVLASLRVRWPRSSKGTLATSRVLGEHR
jgi:hypothetical protein